MINEKPTKVLIVAGTMHIGGIENQLMYLIRNKKNKNLQIDYTTTMEHPFYQDEIESFGGKCTLIPHTNGWRFFRYCKALFRVIKQGEYEVVHSNELFHSGLVALTARLAGVQIRISHAHSCNQDYGKNIIRHFYHRMMRRLILCNSTHFFACSSMAAEFLFGKKIFDNPNYQLVVNSVDTERYLNPLSETVKNDISLDGWKNVLQVGRFCDVKNYLFTCDLAYAIKKAGQRIRFVCVGNDGNDYETLVREKIKELEIEDYMILLGVRDDINFLMKQADAFILPSIYEGMPLTLIEAQTAGLPCVVSDRFSHEVDFNIGAVTWLQLEDDISVWCDAIAQAVDKDKTDQSLIVSAINKYGFESKLFAERVFRIYQS